MQFDQESILERLEDSLRSKASWADILFYSTNRRLLEVISEGISQLASYDEWLTRNTKWDLATEKSALVTQAQFMQYDPHRKIGASGNIRVSSDQNFSSSYPKIVAFPKYTTFTDGGDISFVSTQSEDLSPSENYIDIPVIQGEAKTFTYVAQGDDYEEIILDNPNIENNVYEVLVNSVVWTEVDDLNTQEASDKVYEFENKINYDGIIITFGNGIFGKKLSSGDIVEFKYVETLGSTGNVLSSNVITTVDSTIYDIDSTQVEIFCKNTSNLDGGQDEEDIEDIRSNGTLAFQSGDKAITQTDYEYKLEQSPYVLKSVVWGAYEYNLDRDQDLWTWIETNENVVNVSAFTPGGEQLTDTQKEEIIEDLKPDKPPTDIIVFNDTNFINLAWHIEAYVIDESYVLSEVKTSIINGITDRYSLENLEFFQPIYETEWKGYVNSISGICHHSSYIEIYIEDDFNSAYEADFSLDLYPIEHETVKIYIKGNELSEYTLIGVDDGDGNFISETPYDLTDSSINYNTGEGQLYVNSGLSGDYADYEIKIYYQVDGFNLCPTERNQIFKVAEIDDVTTQFVVEGECD